MRTKTTIIFWLALMVTAILVSAAFFYLMRHEADRLKASWKNTAIRQAELLSADLCKVVLNAEESIGAQLKQLSQTDLQSAFLDWPRYNPLVRNVFVWEDGQLLYPEEHAGIDSEESRFKERYRALFEERTPWISPSDIKEESGVKQAQRKSLRQKAPAPQKTKIQILAQQARQTQMPMMQQKASRQRERSKVYWKTWFYGEHLFLLGYVVENNGQLVYGAEVEVAALLSRLVPVFSAEPDQGYGFVLKDNRDTIIHITSAKLDDIEGEKPFESISLSPVLPNWDVEVYSVNGHVGNAGRKIAIVGIALALILVISIIGCGSMLFWLARLNMIDAARKTSFVSNVSHELKTPLTTIRMYAEMLGEKRIKDPAKKEHYLKVIIEQSCRLTRLVNNVLDFSRIEQSRKRYRIEKCDVVSETLAIVGTQRPRIEKSGMDLNIEMPDEKHEVELDRDVLEQVLINLIDKAIKYASDGKEVKIAWKGAGRIAVCDRGPGIPPSQRKRIFQSFHRLDDSLTARQSGCGLGLTIARQLLRGMGGELLYKPREGGGACFEIVLPKEN